MRKITAFRYLFYLSAIDLLVLLVCSTDASLTFGFSIQVRLFSRLACKLHTFLTYFLTHMSSVVLTAVSIDRVVVLYSMKKFIGPFGKSYRTEKAICALALLIAFLNVHYIIYLDLNVVDYETQFNTTFMCFPTDDSAYFYFLSYIWVGK
jgi:hypothetical protein